MDRRSFIAASVATSLALPARLQAQSGNTLRRVVASEMTSLDPQRPTGQVTAEMAAELFAGLEESGCGPGRYRMLEVSPDLRERQRDLLARRHPGLLHRFEWVDRMPNAHRGFIVANEVLDTVPCERVGRVGGELVERGVCIHGSLL